jgi:hypothetical protein
VREAGDGWKTPIQIKLDESGMVVRSKIILGSGGRAVSVEGGARGGMRAANRAEVG